MRFSMQLRYPIYIQSSSEPAPAPWSTDTGEVVVAGCCVRGALVAARGKTAGGGRGARGDTALSTPPPPLPPSLDSNDPGGMPSGKAFSSFANFRLPPEFCLWPTAAASAPEAVEPSVRWDETERIGREEAAAAVGLAEVGEAAASGEGAGRRGGEAEGESSDESEESPAERRRATRGARPLARLRPPSGTDACDGRRECAAARSPPSPTPASAKAASIIATVSASAAGTGVAAGNSRTGAGAEPSTGGKKIGKFGG